MASAQELKSGSFRVQAKKMINGVQYRKSFVVSPKDFPGPLKEAKKKAKTQAEFLAREWQLKTETDTSLITVKQAMDSYIEKKTPVLSESTIHGYFKMCRYLQKKFTDFTEKDIRELTSKDIQSLINDSIIDGAGAKTIRNRLGFVLSSLDFAGIDKKFRYTIPKANKPVLSPPEPSEFHRLLSMATPEEKLIVILAGLYTLRRGEIAGLYGEDMLWDLNSIYVHTSVVLDINREWIRRPFAKTKLSERVIKIDPEIMKLFPKVGPKEPIFNLNPKQISRRFVSLRKRACVNCRLHDLRKFAASIRSEFMPTKYIEAEGGWSKNSNILTTIYDRPFKEKREEYSKIFNEKISKEYERELFG